MNRRLFALSGGFLAAALLAALAQRASVSAAPGEGGQKTGPRVLQAARELFEALGEKGLEKALIDFASKERFNWHFIPRDRKGMPVKELDQGQRTKLVALVRAGLSEEGARKAEAVMAHEEILGELEGPGRKFARDPLLYYVTFFGKPAAQGKWGWRLEGHHLSLNFTLDGERVLSASPVFYGANPAIVRAGPRKGLRLLGGVEDLARELVSSLKEEQLKACLGDEGGQVPEEVPGAETSRYSGPFPRGVSSEKLGEEERGKLGRLIDEYTRNLPEDLVEDLQAARGRDVHFAWRGSLKPYEPHSYLLHGPGFMINYSNVQNGAAHVHSCLRSLRGEFGLAGEGTARN